MRILGTLFGLIFGLTFAGIGMKIALETAVPTYQAWRAMQHWQPGYAQIDAVKAFDNDTQASYRYSIDGVDYQNDKVYVAPFKDNIGAYHHTLSRHLQQLNSQGQPVAIWYNPEDPSQSVIDRNMRWGLFALMTVFCAGFILAGLGVCYACMSGKQEMPKKSRPSLTELRRQWRQQQAESQTSQNFLDFARQQAEKYRQAAAVPTPRPAHSTPWLDKAAWRDNRIRSSAKSHVYMIWIFAVIWNAISLPLLWVMNDEIGKQNYAALLILLFPLIGIFLLVKAWKMLREWQRFGVIELQLDPFPGAIGGHVGGYLFLNKVVDFRIPYKVTLECLYSYVSGTGDNRSRHESVKWSEQGIAHCDMRGRGLRLVFRFDVPEDLPEADVKQQEDYYYWRLTLSADIDGVALNRQYNIPVYATQETSRFIRHNNSAQSDEIRQEANIATQAAINRGDFASTALSRALRYRRQNNRHLFYYPMFRNKALTVIAWLFAAGFDFAAVMINQVFAGDGVLSFFLLIFSFPFALVGLFATIAAVYLPLNNLQITLDTGKITALRRLGFIPIQHHSLYSNQIRKIEIKSSGSSGQSVKRVEHYKLIVHGNHQAKFTIAEDIDGFDLAEQLKKFIADRLNIDV